MALIGKIAGMVKDNGNGVYTLAFDNPASAQILQKEISLLNKKEVNTTRNGNNVEFRNLENINIETLNIIADKIGATQSASKDLFLGGKPELTFKTTKAAQEFSISQTSDRSIIVERKEKTLSFDFKEATLKSLDGFKVRLADFKKKDEAWAAEAAEKDAAHLKKLKSILGDNDPNGKYIDATKIALDGNKATIPLPNHFTAKGKAELESTFGDGFFNNNVEIKGTTLIINDIDALDDNIKINVQRVLNGERKHAEARGEIIAKLKKYATVAVDPNDTAKITLTFNDLTEEDVKTIHSAITNGVRKTDIALSGKTITVDNLDNYTRLEKANDTLATRVESGISKLQRQAKQKEASLENSGVDLFDTSGPTLTIAHTFTSQAFATATAQILNHNEKDNAAVENKDGKWVVSTKKVELKTLTSAMITDIQTNITQDKEAAEKLAKEKQGEKKPEEEHKPTPPPPAPKKTFDAIAYVNEVAKALPKAKDDAEQRSRDDAQELYIGELNKNPSFVKDDIFDMRAFNRHLKSLADAKTTKEEKTSLQEAEAFGRQLVQVASGDANLKKHLKERTTGEMLEENAGMITGIGVALLGMLALGGGDIFSLIITAALAVAAAMFAAPILGPMVQKWMDTPANVQEKDKSVTPTKQQAVTQTSPNQIGTGHKLADLIPDVTGGIPYEIKDTSSSINKDKFKNILANWDVNRDGVISSSELPTISSALGGVKLNDEQKTALNIANASLHRVYNIFDETHELKIDALANALDKDDDKAITGTELGNLTASETLPQGLKEPRKSVSTKK